MALTATAQSAFHPAPSWDETIVPTLRKRLENESRALAKRLSAASITSDDPSVPNRYYKPHPSSSRTTSREPTPTSSYSPAILKPSGIPRPSLSASRPSDGRTTPNSARGYTPTHRARTLSQPKLIERSTSGRLPVGGDTSRSASPVTPGRLPDGMRTRIPVARTRTGSTSSYSPSHTNGFPRSESRNAQLSNGQHAPMTEVSEQGEPYGQPGTAKIAQVYAVDDIVSRPSTDSEERPYEHWYRGEVTRNGGVGEMRVGRRMEMLEIASYGHSIPSRAGTLTSRNGSTRRRAGSIGARDSFYMEDDSRVESSGRVMDEAPLTDVDGEMDTDPEAHYETTLRSPPVDNRSLTPTSYLREQTPSRTSQRDAPPSRIPMPGATRLVSEQPHTPTRPPARSISPSTSRPSAIEPPRTPRTSNHKQSGPASRSPSTPRLGAPTPKRRAKSPAEASGSSKKPKTRQPPVAHMRGRQDEHRRSIAEYPDPGDGDISNAIPTWTQPVPPGGNWDEVVLPVVARKRGLDDQYTKVNGSPQPKQNGNPTPEPAPGTFGYDYSKYRPGQTKEIPMSEFGQRPEPIDESMHEQPPPSPALAPRPPQPPRDQEYEQHVRMMRMQPPPSPAPFSRYLAEPKDEIEPHAVSAEPVQMTHMSIERGHPQQDDEEDGSAGCCKCVIM